MFTQITTGKWDAYKVTVKDTPAKTKAVKFELYRAEGLSSECGPAAPVTSWKAADDILRNWARTAPEKGQGYDKCDFTVTWSDGETYTGRYDLKRHDMGFSDLLAYHIKSYLTFYSGTRRPDWMKPEQYEQALEGINRAEYADFLAKYEIGNSESKAAPVLEVVHDPKPEPKAKATKQPPALTDKEQAKVIHLTNISNRWERDTYNADILPGKFIRLYGEYTNHVNGPVKFDITFEVGDVAEYDSYNLIYTGKIVSIGPKTVTIQHYEHQSTKSRLTIGDFAWKNWDFDLDRIAAHNREESYYI